MSTLDWFGVIAPWFLYVIALIVYYVWEGRREDHLRQQYKEEIENA
ncbi:MAG: hypothetical protein ABEJ58_10410 [Halodesulfurarchaeum sp.]